MQWRKYAPADYEAIAPWFIEHGWEMPPDRGALPTIGFIVEDDEGPCGCAFLYITNSPIAWCEWICTAPRLGRKGFRVLEYLLAQVKRAATDIGVQRIVHLSNPKYRKVFEKRLGFQFAEKADVLIWSVEHAGS